MQKSKLRPKQLKFAQEYLKDLNATQAAIRAGYSIKTAPAIGAENLMKPLIQEFLTAALARQSERTEIDADWVIYQLVGIVDQGRAAVSVLDRNGFPTGEYTANLSAANKALETLGRHLRMFPDGPAVVVDNRSQYVVGDGGAVDALRNILMERQERMHNITQGTNGTV